MLNRAVTLRKVLLSTAGALCLISAAWAQEQSAPWHLGSNDVLQGGVPAAINISNIRAGAHPVTVAVIDSGVMVNHPSLAGRLYAGMDMVSNDEAGRAGRSDNFSPDNKIARCGNKALSAGSKSHGTEVASLIAGNGIDGVWGVNPAATVVPIKLFTSCGMSRDDLLDSLAWAAGLPVAGLPVNAHPARIINLSFSGGRAICEPQLQSMITRLSKMGVFVVAAVGNSYQKPLSEPANCQGVISVGSIDADNNIEEYSALDARTVIYAPAGGRAAEGLALAHRLRVATFESDARGNETPLITSRGVGTSYSAPLVAGYISLILSYHPEFTPDDFLTNVSKFSRVLKLNAKCTECVPRGLAVTSDTLSYFAPSDHGRVLASGRTALKN
jgi:serine protease